MAKTVGLPGEGRHLTQEEVALYVDALKLERTAALRPELRHHVEVCFDCKASIMGLYSLVKEETYFHDQPHPTLAADRPTGVGAIPMFWRVAAAIVFLLGSGVILYRLLPGEAPVQQTTVVENPVKPLLPGAGSVQPPSARDPLAFAELPALESLVDGTLRSSQVEEVVPANGARVGPGTLFGWKQEGTGAQPLDLVILNNKNVVRTAAKVVGGKYVLRDTLASGLYYWKLTGEGELLHVGKFIVQ